MADSNITKKALASSLKKLMEQIPFSQITVGNICELCDMNRKSFYYHFKDKYDLVNWIYATEIKDATDEKTYTSIFDFLCDICKYFESNRKFYRKILKIDGQNPFYEYFREWLLPIIGKHISIIFENDENDRFYTVFFTDAFVNSIRNWILSPNPLPAEKYVSLTKSCVYGMAKKIAYNAYES